MRPDYLVIFPEWHWELALNPIVLEEMADFRTPTNTIIGEQRAVVYQVRYWPYVETADPQHSSEATFGDAISLLGYDLIVDEQL
jgi:hypothetical protein